MSRIFLRPTALLDGTPDAAKITEPGSDAERYVNEGRVSEKIPNLLGYLSLLEQSGVPRLPGFVKHIMTPSHNIVVVHGEDVPPEEDVPVYGFSLSPDGVREFIGIGRYTGEFGQNGQMLSWADYTNLEDPAFRTPDLTGVINDEAKVSELTQLLAIVEDASEWALD